MQASRLLSILLKLQTQGRLSAAALAEAFEVSVRTIYRDIDALSAAGVPIYADKGRHGGFALRDGYHTRLTGLDRPEAQSLFLSGVPFAADQLGLGGALDSTRLKLLAALPEAARQEAEKVASRFHLDPVAWYQGPDEQGLLPELAAAVWLQRGVEMRYDSWKGLVERDVAPLGLVLKGGLWYFVAATEERARTYRVASIVALTVQDSPAPPPPAGFELKRYWEAFARDFEARMQAASAVVRARPAGLRELARQSHAIARAVAAAQPPDAEGWQRLRIPIESVEAAVGQLLRLGPDVEALEPPELRTALRQAVLNLNGLYGE
ncbi:helix-turn-helix transcriptional regulator [Roseateles toxinivorans]|uniref:Putative DNA-binding transcriptional regulator YafY n=1 Tax=Roseateles toxinivorans TaxID=270368 RepID=A0A4R6QGX6_9BURK|nr:YafY family protein [Roseateles toxinivorans]TDP61606.1 putative DNA-binding transcriptional regulator YafY [Roseateles toxinivorans]